MLYLQYQNVNVKLEFLRYYLTSAIKVLAKVYGSSKITKYMEFHRFRKKNELFQEIISIT